MSETAAADDSARTPLNKAVSMTIITRVLFTLLKQMELFPSGFKESFTCKEVFNWSQQEPSGIRSSFGL